MGKSNTVISSLLWKAGERMLVQGLNLLVQVILARLLMPEDFASLAIIAAIVNYLGLFVQSGLSVAVVQKSNLTSKDIATLTTISLLAALVMYIGLFFAAPVISNYYDVGDLVLPIRVMGVTLFIFAFNSIQTGLLQRKMQFRTIFFRSMLATPLSGIIGITMAYLGYGIWALIAFNISNTLIIVLFMNMIPELRLKLGFSLQSAKELYSFSIKILGTSLVSAGGDTVRTLTIGKHFNANQLAYFDRGLSYSGLVTQVVNTSLSSVMLPVLSRQQEDMSNLRNMVRKSVGMSSFLMIPVLVMIAVVSEPLVRIILSEKWVPCAIYLSIFCLLRIPGIITSIDKQAYYALGKSQIGLYYEIFLLAANLISLFFMLDYGVLAIALGFIVVEYLGNFVLFIVSEKVYHYTLKDRFLDLFKPVLSSIIMVVCMCSLTFILKNSFALLVSQIVLGALSYLILSVFLKDKNMIYVREKIRSLIGKNK